VSIDRSVAAEQHLAALRADNALTSRELVSRMRGLDRRLTLTDIVWDSQLHRPVWDLQEVLTERSETVQWVPTRQLIGDWGQDQGWREFPDEPNAAWCLLRRLGQPHWIDNHPLPAHELSSPLGSVYEVDEEVRGSHNLVVYEALDLPFVPIKVCGRYRVRETTPHREREGRGAATIYDFVQQRGLVTVNGGREIDPASPAPWLALRLERAVKISHAFTRAHPNWMQSWGLTAADFADEWALRSACAAKASRLTRRWYTVLGRLDKMIGPRDGSARDYRGKKPQPEPWRALTWTLSSISDFALTWTLSSISDFHNGALVMQLQPLDGEKPATLDDRVAYRVCRACGYGFIGNIELHTSGGHGMGREIIHRIIGPHRDLQWGASPWKLSSVGFWEKMSAELAVDIVQNGPPPVNCPHACDPFSLDVLQVGDIYYPAHLVQPVV
jgi:hypothetical protein